MIDDAHKSGLGSRMKTSVSNTVRNKANVGQYTGNFVKNIVPSGKVAACQECGIQLPEGSLFYGREFIPTRKPGTVDFIHYHFDCALKRFPDSSFFSIPENLPPPPPLESQRLVATEETLTERRPCALKHECRVETVQPSRVGKCVRYPTVWLPKGMSVLKVTTTDSRGVSMFYFHHSCFQFWKEQKKQKAIPVFNANDPPTLASPDFIPSNYLLTPRQHTGPLGPESDPDSDSASQACFGNLASSSSSSSASSFLPSPSSSDGILDQSKACCLCHSSKSTCSRCLCSKTAAKCTRDCRAPGCRWQEKPTIKAPDPNSDNDNDNDNNDDDDDPDSAANNDDQLESLGFLLFSLSQNINPFFWKERIFLREGCRCEPVRLVEFFVGLFSFFWVDGKDPRPGENTVTVTVNKK